MPINQAERCTNVPSVLPPYPGDWMSPPPPIPLTHTPLAYCPPASLTPSHPLPVPSLPSPLNPPPPAMRPPSVWCWRGRGSHHLPTDPAPVPVPQPGARTPGGPRPWGQCGPRGQPPYRHPAAAPQLRHAGPGVRGAGGDGAGAHRGTQPRRRRAGAAPATAVLHVVWGVAVQGALCGPAPAALHVPVRAPGDGWGPAGSRDGRGGCRRGWWGRRHWRGWCWWSCWQCECGRWGRGRCRWGQRWWKGSRGARRRRQGWWGCKWW
jgi:hypothetical protein